jgi:hypothetical protein
MSYSYSINSNNDITLNAPIEIEGSLILNSNDDNVSHFNQIFTTNQYTLSGSDFLIYPLPRLATEDSIMNINVTTYYVSFDTNNMFRNFGYINKIANIHSPSDIETPISITYSPSDSDLYPSNLTFDITDPDVVNIKFDNINMSRPNLSTSTTIEYSYLSKNL